MMLWSWLISAGLQLLSVMKMSEVQTLNCFILETKSF